MVRFRTQVPSLGTHRKVIDSVIKAKIMGLSTPGGQSSGLEHYISV